MRFTFLEMQYIVWTKLDKGKKKCNWGCDEGENTLGIWVNLVDWVEQLREKMENYLSKEKFFKWNETKTQQENWK